MAVSVLKHVALSINQLSTETGFARATVRSRIDEAGVKPCGTRGGHPVFRLRDVLPTLYFGEGESFDPDKLKPFERHAYYKAEREKLHLQIERRDVVPMLEVERLYGVRNKQVVQKVTTMLDVLERDCGLTPTQADRLQRHIDELLDNLYKLSEDDDADSADRDRA